MTGFLAKPILALSFWLAATQASAWSQHRLLTAAALAQVPAAQKFVRIVTPWEQLVKKLGFSNPQAFNESIQIRKEYRFAFFNNEKIGDEVSVAEVLSKYSDEPDWGMDKELFGTDQYPQIWKSDYAYMGGKHGTPSQAFRHMYWLPIQWSKPVATLNFPFLMSPAGTAPERAEVFHRLAIKARQLGEPYWSYRFLANALHYVEDLSQPFHATQLPTKEFLFLAAVNGPQPSWWSGFPGLGTIGSSFELFVKKTTQVNAYYHFFFEDYVGHVMAAAPHSNFGTNLRTVIGTFGGTPTGICSPKQLVIEMAQASVSEAAKAGQSSIEFFPELPSDLMAMNTESIVEKWLHEVNVDHYGTGTSAREDLESVVTEQFRRLGRGIRCLIQSP